VTAKKESGPVVAAATAALAVWGAMGNAKREFRGGNFLKKSSLPLLYPQKL
jgi:hypothetical protein